MHTIIIYTAVLIVLWSVECFNFSVSIVHANKAKIGVPQKNPLYGMLTWICILSYFLFLSPKMKVCQKLRLIQGRWCKGARGMCHSRPSPQAFDRWTLIFLCLTWGVHIFRASNDVGPLFNCGSWVHMNTRKIFKVRNKIVHKPGGRLIFCYAARNWSILFRKFALTNRVPHNRK